MATYNCSTSADLEAAAAADAVGDVININASITATTLSTLLVFNAGITVNLNGFTLSGFYYQFTGGTSGYYDAPTTINGGGGTIDLASVFPTASTAGVRCANGIYAINELRITGEMTEATKKNFIALASSTARCECTLTDCEIDNSAGDCCSANCSSSPTAAASGSFLKCYNCHFHDPGTGSADNCLTGHDYFPVYMYGGQLSGVGGGPMVNSGPANQTMELYGVAWDFTGHLGSNSRVSALVGCTVTGDAAAVANGISIHGSSTTTSLPGIACFNTVSCCLYRGATETTTGQAHVIYGNTLTRANTYIADITGLALGSHIARNTIEGPTVANTPGIETFFTGKVFNNTINVPASPAVNVYPVRLSTPSDASTNSTEIKRCQINSASRTINYCVRSDAARTAAVITETIGYSTVALFAGTATNTNSRNDGTNPNAYAIGAANICDDLKLLPAYGLEGYDQATSPVDDIGLYYNLLPATMTSVVADSSSQCTVSYTNNNSSSRDHRIERATDSGFTTGLTTFDVTGVATGAVTYVDTTCNPSTTYYYRVRAKNGNALSIASSSANDTTDASGSGGGAVNMLLLGVGPL